MTTVQASHALETALEIELRRGEATEPGVGHAATHALQRALDQHAVRAETVRRLVRAIEEQQALLGSELKAVLRALGTTPSVMLASTNAAPVAVEPLADHANRTVVRCLGSLEVTMAGVPIRNWRSGKARAVFEYLVAHRHRPVTRDRLIQALWPDPDALASGTSLKVAVHALRQIFTENRGAAARPALGVLVQESSYQLSAPGLWVDVEEFERCATLAARLDAQGQVREALAAYERAADLYRGDFLSDAWDEWVVFRREGLRDQYLTILARLADARLSAGDYEGCISVCRQLLEQDCCREDTYKLLMVCHAQLGQRGRVRRWYELCVQALRSNLELEPEPETVRIYQWSMGGRSSGPLAFEGSDLAAILTPR
jgi:DNA-binding SARP family transcriptional activator